MHADLLGLWRLPLHNQSGHDQRKQQPLQAGLLAGGSLQASNKSFSCSLFCALHDSLYPLMHAACFVPQDTSTHLPHAWQVAARERVQHLHTARRLQPLSGRSVQRRRPHVAAARAALPLLLVLVSGPAGKGGGVQEVCMALYISRKAHCCGCQAWLQQPAPCKA
jgi:hypothetical protein